jgi:UDP-2,3-diacylglucosamine hydrolase
VFGHRHLAIDHRLSEGSRYINLGDWIHYYSYAVFDGKDMSLRSFLNKDEKIIRK